jgi:hypothetical protein
MGAPKLGVSIIGTPIMSTRIMGVPIVGALIMDIPIVGVPIMHAVPIMGVKGVPIMGTLIKKDLKEREKQKMVVEKRGSKPRERPSNLLIVRINGLFRTFGETG